MKIYLLNLQNSQNVSLETHLSPSKNHGKIIIKTQKHNRKKKHKKSWFKIKKSVIERQNINKSIKIINCKSNILKTLQKHNKKIQTGLYQFRHF